MDIEPVRTFEMQLWSIKQENGQGPDQVRPLRPVTVYRLVAGQASPLLTVEVDVTGIRCQVHSVRVSEFNHARAATY